MDTELHRGEKGWPACLEDLERVPETLYVRGDPSVLQGSHISVVGARRATPYGLAASQMAGRVAAECGITVVSGGALGCDSAAARAALSNGGKTIVVTGTGADCVYPERSRDVFKRAVEQGGAVVSLLPWGCGPQKWTFRQRNYVIAALGEALFVCEAGTRSGTFSTAEAAADLGRRVYAVPGSIFSPQSAGTNRLIADGAAIVCCEEDLEAMIALDFGSIRLREQRVMPKEGRVLSALIASPMRPDDLAAALGEDPLTLVKTLSEYEAKGIVERMWDGRYGPSASYLLERGRIGAQQTQGQAQPA